MYVLIVNPASGRGASMARLGEVESLLQSRKIEYRIDCAAAPEEATRLARSAAEEEPDGIIAIGGDGTIFDIVNGIAGSSVPLLFVSCGTGNDFVRCLNLPRDPIEALKCQLDSPITRIDLGRMNQLYFANVSGTGFDVDVLRHAEKYKRQFSGLRPYLQGLIEAVKTYRPMTAMLSFDDAPEERATFAILSIGNGRYIGGGMKAVPDADPGDGLFDVITVKPVPRLAILPLIVFFITGNHVKLRVAHLRRCKRLSVRCPNMTVNLDGELRVTDVARYELLPGAIAVRIPSGT